MSDATSLVEQAKELCKRIEDELSSSKDDDKRPPVIATTQRQLFGELARLRNSAEASSSTDALEMLDAIRSKLRIPKKAQTSGQKMSMYLRLFFTAFIALWGALCILVLAPLRFLHPVLRQYGVPNGRLPLDVLIEQWARAVLAAAGVKVRIVGGADWASQMDLVGIMVYNHASNLDPFIVNIATCTSPKYIGKKVLFSIPIVGWLFVCMGMVPINRGDREKAQNTMNEAVSGIMRKWLRSVAISPEGTRTTDGHLRLPFKKGIFHLQERTKVALLPVVIHGAYELWPPGRLFTSPGEVTVDFLPPQLPVEASKDCNSRDATRLALQSSYCEFTAKHPDRGASALSSADIAKCVCRLLVTLVAYRAVWWLPCAAGDILGLGVSGWAALFVATSIGVALYVEKFL